MLRLLGAPATICSLKSESVAVLNCDDVLVLVIPYPLKVVGRDVIEEKDLFCLRKT